MPKNIFLIIIGLVIILLFIIIGFNVLGQQEQIKGINLIKDDVFKKQLLDFIKADSQRNYKELYYCLSKPFIKKHFPNVNNAEEYAKEMEIKDERKHTKHLEILNHKRIDEKKYQVELTLESNNEGYLQKIKMRYFFIREENTWKYDGLDLNFMEVEATY